MNPFTTDRHSANPLSSLPLPSVVLADLGELLRLCNTHIDDENGFVHPAIEARNAGGSARIAGEHGEHERHIADLAAMAQAVEETQGPARDDAARRLYRALAMFVAENFEHMLYEETRHNALLWATYSDIELMQIEGALVASLPPQTLQLTGFWMLRAFSHEERVGFVAGIRDHAPAELYALIMRVAGDALPARSLHKLEQALAALVPQALAA